MKVVTLNTQEFSNCCKELISKIDIEPDLIVGILNGGGYVMEQFKNSKRFPSAAFKTVLMKRDDSLKQNKVVSFFLKYLPYPVLNKLRIFESLKVKKSINKIDISKLEEVKTQIDLNDLPKDQIKNILIVDDALDSGKTMYKVKNSLSLYFSEAKLMSAVISWTIPNSIINPDYYLYKNTLVRFPWSKDYKGKDFEKKSFSS